MRIGRILKRLVKVLKAPKVLTFITISFPMFWLFAIISETKRVLVSFRVFQLLESKIKNVVVLPFR